MPSMQPAIKGEPFARMTFTEETVTGWPASDRKLTAPDGLAYRESMLRLEQPNGYEYQFRLRRINADGTETEEAPYHGVTVLGQGAVKMGKTGVQDALLKAREEALSIADAHFKGMDLLDTETGNRI